MSGVPGPQETPDFIISDAGVVASGGVPERIGKYRIDSIVGRGGSGIVYKGHDPFVSRDVAVKVALQPTESAESQKEAQKPAEERLFFTEARAAGMLQHPHIVTLFDAGEIGPHAYIVMEYIDGDTLKSLCRPSGPRASLEQVIDIIYKCAKALHYSHEKGVLHRDIKPSNIMLTRDGEPKIMDFSIAAIAQRGEEAQQVGVGSPLYMSPEQVRRQPIGPQSDLYSLGAVMYQLLTGSPPFTGENLPSLFAAIRNAPVPRPEAKSPDLPKEIGDIVVRLLAKDPRDRYQTGDDLARELIRLFERLRAADRQLSRRESRDSLRSLRFFGGFNESEIEEILNASSLQTFAPGDRIVTEGDIDSAFYIIARGSVEVFKGSRKLQGLDRGDCFGEISFLSASRRTATVRAATPVVVLKVNASLMDSLSVETQLHFYKVFTETLIYRLAITSAKLSAATQSSS
jgi:serine/threonine-protein kinase